MKPALLFLVFFTLFISARAGNDHTPSSDLLFMRSHFGLQFGLPVLFTQHSEHKGLGSLEIKRLPGFFVGFKYEYHFNQYIGLSFEPAIGMHSVGYDVSMNKDDFLLEHDIHSREKHQLPFLMFPFSVTPKVRLSNKSILSFNAGGRLHFFIPFSSITGIAYGDKLARKELFLMRMKVAGKPVFNLHAGVGYRFLLNNNNIIHFTVRYVFGFNTLFDGEYTFHGNDKILGLGKINSNNSYLSAGFTYSFTRTRGLITHQD